MIFSYHTLFVFHTIYYPQANYIVYIINRLNISPTKKKSCLPQKKDPSTFVQRRVLLRKE